jgi:hypothetical protein
MGKTIFKMEEKMKKGWKWKGEKGKVGRKNEGC